MKAFTRVRLDPGERRAIGLAIPYADLALVAADGDWRVEPGSFDLWLGCGAGEELHTRFDAL
jgi:beta-glucosidase